MSVDNTTVELDFVGIAANVPISVDINLFVREDAEVRYGVSRVLAVLDVDYSLILLPPAYGEFALTPKTALYNKIVALIAAVPGEQNILHVRRRTPLTSDFVESDGFIRRKIANEFDRVNMRLQELHFDFDKFTTPVEDLEDLVAAAAISAATAAAQVALAAAQVAIATAQAVAAAASATTATTQAGVATTQAGTATTQAGIATTQAGLAASAATTAANAAVAPVAADVALLKAPEYLVSAAHATLTGERVATATPTISWDFTTAAQGKANVVAPFRCGQLTRLSATALQFLPFMGDLIKINGNNYQIPSTGMVGLGNTGVYVAGVAGQNLAASTTYLVYGCIIGGVLTADFRTGGSHATSATAGNIGVEIRAGPDNDRSLVGMIRTNASSQFVDTPQLRYVRSWFNEGLVESYGQFSATRNTTSSTNVEINTEIRIEALIWAGETWTVTQTVAGFGNSTVNTSSASSLSFDGAAVEPAGVLMSLPNLAGLGGFSVGAASKSVKTGLSEGLHYATIFGSVSGGTASWSSGGAGFRTALTGSLKRN